jgi:predicted site-specific integrase-resolvase
MAIAMGKREALKLIERNLVLGVVISVKDHLDRLGYFIRALTKV